MKRNNKKGFTIVELVIVIAVIVVLAAVLIPTFASIIKKANESVDMQVVKQMNTILQADELANSKKPATVVDAQNILVANGANDFTPADPQNVFYWIGSENRVILWQKDEGDDVTTGKVTYPKELAKKYKDTTTPSVDWNDLSAEYVVQNITPSADQTLEAAFLEALANAGTDEEAYIVLPENSTLNFSAAQNRQLSSLLKSNAGIGKRININMNGSTINAVDVYGIDIPDNGSLELSNGTFNHKNDNYDDSTFQVGVGASLILRNMELNLVAHTGIAPLDDASEVIIDNTVINSDAHFGISTNGMTSRVVRIIINDSTINNTVNGGGVGINVNATANVHISDSRVAGYAHALLLRAGHVEAENTTLETVATSAGIFKYDSFTHFLKKPKINGSYVEGASETYTWRQANACPGAVLVAGDYAREAESYPGDVDVTLTNVTFKSANTSEIPHCLVAAKLTKNVTLTYDDKTNIEDVKMYNYMIPQYFGSITVNGEAKTLS